MPNALNGFDIPAVDIDRAAKFYGALLQTEITVGDAMPGNTMAMFPAEDGVGGALVQAEGYLPSTEGSIVYLSAGDSVDAVLARVDKAGGEVLLPKTDIGEHGFVTFIKDTEGNKVGLHAMG
jgi:predicted enzyme related to lactoylglutathione lyase